MGRSLYMWAFDRMHDEQIWLLRTKVNRFLTFNFLDSEHLYIGWAPLTLKHLMFRGDLATVFPSEACWWVLTLVNLTCSMAPNGIVWGLAELNLEEVSNVSRPVTCSCKSCDTIRTGWLWSWIPGSFCDKQMALRRRSICSWTVMRGSCGGSGDMMQMGLLFMDRFFERCLRGRLDNGMTMRLYERWPVKWMDQWIKCCIWLMVVSMERWQCLSSNNLLSMIWRKSLKIFSQNGERCCFMEPVEQSDKALRCEMLWAMRWYETFDNLT